MNLQGGGGGIWYTVSSLGQWREVATAEPGGAHAVTPLGNFGGTDVLPALTRPEAASPSPALAGGCPTALRIG